MPAHALSGQPLPGPLLASQALPVPQRTARHPDQPLAPDCVAPRTDLAGRLGQLGLGLFILPFWLAVVAVAALVLGLMLVMDAGLVLIDAVQPGPAPERRRWRTGALF